MAVSPSHFRSISVFQLFSFFLLGHQLHQAIESQRGIGHGSGISEKRVGGGGWNVCQRPKGRQVGGDVDLVLQARDGGPGEEEAVGRGIAHRLEERGRILIGRQERGGDVKGHVGAGQIGHGQIPGSIKAGPAVVCGQQDLLEARFETARVVGAPGEIRVGIGFFNQSKGITRVRDQGEDDARGIVGDHELVKDKVVVGAEGKSKAGHGVGVRHPILQGDESGAGGGGRSNLVGVAVRGTGAVNTQEPGARRRVGNYNRLVSGTEVGAYIIIGGQVRQGPGWLARSFTWPPVLKSSRANRAVLVGTSKE